MKNKVKIDYRKKIIIKRCKTHAEYLNEIYIYNQNFTFVPKLLAKNNKDTIVLEYIESKTIGEIDEPDFSKLGGIFAELHSHKNKSFLSICHNDTNPKNYIVDKNENYFMIDVSDWTYDFPEKDIIHFLMFWASIYSQKKFELSSIAFLSSYQEIIKINQKIWQKYYCEIENKFDKRRLFFNKKEILVSNILKSNRQFLQNIILKKIEQN